MDTPSPTVQKLARRLLAVEAASKSGGDARVPEVVRVCEKLRASLTRFAGADGFASLLRRSLSLARAEAFSLSHLTLKPDGSMDGLETATAGDADGGVEARAAIIAHLLELLVTFIGEPLTLKLVRESWPDASLDEPHKEN